MLPALQHRAPPHPAALRLAWSASLQGASLPLAGVLAPVLLATVLLTAGLPGALALAQATIQTAPPASASAERPAAAPAAAPASVTPPMTAPKQPAPAANSAANTIAKPAAKPAASDLRRLGIPDARSALPLPCTAQGQPPPAAWPLKFPDELEAARQKFLAGKCAYFQGDWARAENIFRQGLAEDKDLPNVWRLYVLRAQLALGKHAEALATLAEALKPEARPAVRDAVRQLLATAFSMQGAPQAASQTNPGPGATAAANTMAGNATSAASAVRDAEFDYLATYLVNVRPTVEDYDLLERLLALAQSRHDDALQRRLPLVLWRMPKDEAAAQRWSEAPRQSQAEVRAALAADDYLERARRLSDLRLYAQLETEVEAKDYPTLEQEAARKLARLYFIALFQIKAFRQAAAALESPQMRQRLALDSRLLLGVSTRLAIRKRDIQQTVALLDQLEALDPQPENIPGFYLELAKYYESGRDYASMAQWCQKLVQKYPKSQAAPSAYWMLIWNSYKRQRWEDALRWSEQAVGRAADFTQDDQARFLYWKGRIEQRADLTQAAAETWSGLTQRWPSGYYGLIATEAEHEHPLPPRFVSTRYAPAPRAEPPDLQAVLKVPAIAGALWVYAVDEDQLANAMLQEALTQNLPGEVVKSLGQLFLAMNEHYLQQRLIANHDPLGLTRQPVGDSPLWRQSYPPAFWNLVTDEAGLNDVSPYFILAVMREESRFKVKADSRAGAKGLMQIMPGTAQELAQRSQIAMDESTLLLPEFNIPIGVLYLKNVLRRFDWNPIYAAAAYNAGPGAVMRWTRSLGPLPFDEFVERIPYEETQTYVKRVYASYLIYQQLYP